MNELAARADALQQAYAGIALTRMAGLPLVHPRLTVATVDFRADAQGDTALGVLLTPWCMNLVRLPLREGMPMLAVGERGARDIGSRRFDFIGAHEAGVGSFEACSLFSPMFEFADQAAALATAQQALNALRARQQPAQPARRGFLFGRSPGASA